MGDRSFFDVAVALTRGRLATRYPLDPTEHATMLLRGLVNYDKPAGEGLTTGEEILLNAALHLEDREPAERVLSIEHCPYCTTGETTDEWAPYCGARCAVDASVDR